MIRSDPLMTCSFGSLFEESLDYSQPTKDTNTPRLCIVLLLYILEHKSLLSVDRIDNIDNVLDSLYDLVTGMKPHYLGDHTEGELGFYQMHLIQPFKDVVINHLSDNFGFNSR